MLRCTKAGAFMSVRTPTTFSFLTVIAAYFFLHVLIRVNLSHSLELDEAEVVFFSQDLRLGYGPQPPLYTWLQWIFFSVFGLKLFSISLLKNLLLLATYLCMFITARPLVGVHGAMAASVSLIFFPQIAWESQRDQTHSVLLTTFASATLCCYFSVLHKPTVARHVLLGVLIGLGLQTKYNFAVFLAGLAFASLVVKEHREALWNNKMALTVAAAILVLLPHALWLADNLQAATRGTLRKMAEGAVNTGYLHNVATGLTSMVLATLAFIAPIAIVYGLICRRYWKQGKRFPVSWGNPDLHFFLVLYGSFFALLSLLVLTGEVSKIKDRWLQPLLFSLPLAFFVALPSLPKQEVFPRVARIAAIFAVAVLLLIPLRVCLGPAMNKYVRANYPYEQLATELHSRFAHAATILSEGTLTAGNLHFQDPGWRTLVLDDVIKRNAELEGEVLLVMHDDAEPGWMERFRAAYPQADVREQGRLTLNYRFGGKDTMSFDYVRIVIRSL